MFLSTGDASSALRDSIVMREGRPWYVTNVGGTAPHGIVLAGVPLGSFIAGRIESRATSFELDYKKVTWNSFPLGYTQVEGSAYYLSRIPNRQWKRGLSRNNIHVRADAAFGGLGLNWTAWFGKPLENTLLGKYPSYEKAIELLKEYEEENEGNTNSVAFNRFMAISFDELGQLKLHLKGDVVAYGDDKNAFKLGKYHKYLENMLRHNGVNVNV